MGQIMRRTNRGASVVVRVHSFLACAASLSKTVSQCAFATVARALVPKTTVRTVTGRTRTNA